MTIEATTARVREIISDILCLHDKDLTDAPLSDQGGDSLDDVEISMALQEEFDIRIDDVDWEQAKTIPDYVQVVLDKQAMANG
jgi:acyl carrier protein